LKFHSCITIIWVVKLRSTDHLADVSGVKNGGKKWVRELNGKGHFGNLRLYGSITLKLLDYINWYQDNNQRRVSLEISLVRYSEQSVDQLSDCQFQKYFILCC
jgi:hypothetical protein